MLALDVALTAVLGFHVFVGAPGGVCSKRLLHGCENYARCQAFVKRKIVFLYYFVQPDNTGTSIFFFFIVSWHLQLDPYGFASPRSSYPAAALWNMNLALSLNQRSSASNASFDPNQKISPSRKEPTLQGISGNLLNH
jgi:hypothetical protein